MQPSRPTPQSVFNCTCFETIVKLMQSMKFKKIPSFHTLLFVRLCNSLQDEMFQKFNFDTEWAVRLISKITNDEDMPIEGDAIVKQVIG